MEFDICFSSLLRFCLITFFIYKNFDFENICFAFPPNLGYFFGHWKIFVLAFRMKPKRDIFSLHKKRDVQSRIQAKNSHRRKISAYDWINSLVIYTKCRQHDVMKEWCH